MYGLRLAGFIFLAAAVFVGAAWLIFYRPVIDRGPCLASHDVAKHEDAYTLCLPTVGFDGQTTLACHVEDAVDWTETVCDQWTYPHGKAEQGP